MIEERMKSAMQNKLPDVPDGFDARSDMQLLELTTPVKAKRMKLSIGWEDAWETGIKLNDVDEADLQAIEYSFYWEDPDFQISYTETAHGTKLLVAKLPDNSTVYIYTLYEGYEIEFKLVSADPAGLTQEQIDTCIQFLSDMDFVPNVK